MDNKRIIWEIKEVAPGMVELNINPFGRVPTIEEFKEKAKELLKRHKKRPNLENLKDENYSPDIAENLLLKMELQDKEENNSYEIFQVIIPVGNGKVIVNDKNINSVLSNENGRKKLPNEFGANPNITEEVLEER